MKCWRFDTAARLGSMPRQRRHYSFAPLGIGRFMPIAFRLPGSRCHRPCRNGHSLVSPTSRRPLVSQCSAGCRHRLTGVVRHTCSHAASSVASAAPLIAHHQHLPHHPGSLTGYHRTAFDSLDDRISTRWGDAERGSPIGELSGQAPSALMRSHARLYSSRGDIGGIMFARPCRHSPTPAGSHAATAARSESGFEQVRDDFLFILRGFYSFHARYKTGA